MNISRTETGCPVCGAATPLSPEVTFCMSCERRILAAIRALEENGNAVVVPTSVN